MVLSPSIPRKKMPTAPSSFARFISLSDSEIERSGNTATNFNRPFDFAQASPSHEL